jgi:glutamate synthase (NADPH/NADH) small chain
VRFVGTADPQHTAFFEADMVLKAIGQTFVSSPWAEAGLAMTEGRLQVDAQCRTSLPGVWAGGDCRAGGRDLTVEAVEDGKQAALGIHAFFQTES